MSAGTAAGPTPAQRRYSCADTSAARDEPVLGTASPARSWLCVEEPGPWGPGTVPSSRLGEEVTASLRAAAASRGSRLLLVRRPLGRQQGSPDERRLFRAVCRRGGERLLTRTCAPDDVAVAAADDEGWEQVPGPLLLVCTHGRKDWCCALRGRPVAAALAEVDPEGVWECSHLGGDRFAASVLQLPTGITYGRVQAQDAVEVSAAAHGGRVVPRLLRGRSTDALVVQAADALARAATGRDAGEDLVPVTARRDEGPAAEPHEELWRVRLAGAGGRGDLDVALRPSHVPGTARLTCSAREEQHARTWELVDLVDLPARSSAPAA